MKYSVCASAVLRHLTLPEAVERIHALGFEAYEFWGWQGENLDAIAEAQRRTGVVLAGICTTKFVLNDPALREDYIMGIRESIEAAKRLDCRRLITQVGQAIDGVTRSVQHDSIVDGLKACAPILEDAGVELVVEPLNTIYDHKGYYLDRSDEAFRMIREVGSSNVKVLFDVYHQQITEGNLIENMRNNVGLIGHIHIAGVPGRHEILRGSEVHYPAILAALKEAGYQGAVGLEYFPLNDHEEGLKEILQKMPL